MKFRPCIDIHGGKVKQIVGSSIGKSAVQENYVSEQYASYYASLYKEDGASGGHIILLDKPNSEAYERDLIQAQEALRRILLFTFSSDFSWPLSSAISRVKSSIRSAS